LWGSDKEVQAEFENQNGMRHCEKKKDSANLLQENEQPLLEIHKFTRDQSRAPTGASDDFPDGEDPRLLSVQSTSASRQNTIRKRGFPVLKHCVNGLPLLCQDHNESEG
jgi:hypothetical protein